jgi:hypothetical protein
MMRVLVAACMLFAVPAHADTSAGELAHALDRLGSTTRV